MNKDEVAGNAMLKAAGLLSLTTAGGRLPLCVLRAFVVN